MCCCSDLCQVVGEGGKLEEALKHLDESKDKVCFKCVIIEMVEFDHHFFTWTIT